MIFDDRLITVLQGPVPTGLAAHAQYRQIVDLLAQQSSGMDPRLQAMGLARIHALRDAVPATERLSSVRSLTGRLLSAPLTRYLASDEPAIAGAAMAAARLDDEEWHMLIPDLPVRARGFLRNRRDLGAHAMHTLSTFGPLDLALPAAETGAVDLNEVGMVEAEQPAPVGDVVVSDAVLPDTIADQTRAENVVPLPITTVPEGREIGLIVERIEAFRKARSAAPSPPLSPTPSISSVGLSAIGAPLPHVDFETDASGRFSWVDGVVPGALLGASLAQPTGGDPVATDGYVASAFRQRVAISAGRLTLRGAPAIEGDWRIDAMPSFDSGTGRFQGYRGRLRRPEPNEVASTPRAAADQDSVRQIVHELRTPLNAILGFAEIIGEQLFGPVSHDYRSLAGDIARDARSLLAGFDDLDTALKLDRGMLDIESGLTDCDWLAARTIERLGEMARDRHVAFGSIASPSGLIVALPQDIVERMVVRLVSTVIAAAVAGEHITLAVGGVGTVISMVIDRPSGWQGLERMQLFDPDLNDPAQGTERGGGLLGTGFSLRLVDNLARAHGGALAIEATRLILTLPAGTHSQTERDTLAGKAND